MSDDGTQDFISHTGCPSPYLSINSSLTRGVLCAKPKSSRTRGMGSPQIGSETPLLVRVDWRFIFGFDFIAISPLPVVVAVVVDFLDRDRGLRRDVIGGIIGALIDLVLL